MSLHENKLECVTWLASYNGISIYSNPEIGQGTIRILDTDGKIIGIILNVGLIEVNVGDGK